jgi:PEGA domain
VTLRGFGTLSLRVQPASAVVRVDGDEWLSAREGVLVIELSVGRHAVNVSAPGRTGFSSTVEIRDNETTELNVSVPPAPRGTR